MIMFALSPGLTGTLCILAVVYLILINVISSVVCITDKINAKHGKRRVSEATLLTLCAIGGSVFMYITMLIIRHKTRKAKFMVGIPVIIVLQIAAAVLILH